MEYTKEQFAEYYRDIKYSPEVFGKYTDMEVYQFCASQWSKEHPGASIPSISDLES